MQYFLLLFGYTEVDLTIHLFSKKNDFRENDKSTTPTLFDQVGGGNKEVKSHSSEVHEKFRLELSSVLDCKVKISILHSEQGSVQRFD